MTTYGSVIISGIAVVGALLESLWPVSYYFHRPRPGIVHYPWCLLKQVSILWDFLFKVKPACDVCAAARCEPKAVICVLGRGGKGERPVNVLPSTASSAPTATPPTTFIWPTILPVATQQLEQLFCKFSSKRRSAQVRCKLSS